MVYAVSRATTAHFCLINHLLLSCYVFSLLSTYFEPKKYMSLLFLHGSQVLRTFGLHFNLTLSHCLISVVCAVFHQIFVLFSSSKQKSVDYNFLAKVER